MTTLDLARRAVACKGWRWLKGCVLTDGGIVTGDVHGIPLVYAPGGRHTAETLPDMTDPATKGCLLALVRLAWGNRDLHPVQFTGSLGGRWHVLNRTGWCDTEVEAMVAALEAAPENTNA